MYLDRQQALLLLLLCVTLNVENIDSVENDRQQRAFPVSYGPNFDPELPNFGPFNTKAFVRITSDDDADNVDDDHNVATIENDNSPTIISPNEQPILPDPFRPKLTKPHSTKDVEFTERLKPLQDFVMGLYQTYRTSYVGNQTVADLVGPLEMMIENKLDDDSEPGRHPSAAAGAPTKAKKRKTKTKKKHLKAVGEFPGDDVKYNVGPGVNVSLDPEKELVNVYLDEDCLKDVFTGRGRKHDIIHKILPLFILPFLIQSAIVPFVVTTLKLLLVKSIVVGKIAIFLLIISAFKNKNSSGYEAAPSYIVDPPSRRSEAAVGYRVEGKPTTWVN